MENRQLKLPIGRYHISALPHPKLSQAHAWMLKGWKWLRNHRKIARNYAKKILVKQGKDIGSSVKNRENIKRKQRPVIFAKNWRFNSGQNGRVGISLEFPSNNFFTWNQSAPDICYFWNYLYPPQKSNGPEAPYDHLLHPSTIKFIWQMFNEWSLSVSRATKDLSSESCCKTQWKTGFYYITGLVLNSLCSTVHLLISYVCCLFWSF